MPAFSPATLAAWTGGRWTEVPWVPLTGFCTDSRQVRPGQMFVALKTEKRDGHDFLDAAATAGAGAALVSGSDPSLPLPQLVVADPLLAFQAIAREHRRKFVGPVIGVTGSAGKTSTKELTATLLGERVLATEGNLNNHIGVPLTLTRLDAAEHDYAVIEAGVSAPGEMAPLAAMIAPDVAIVTLISPAHLHELGGLEGVAREKAGLAAAVRGEGVAIFPAACNQFAAFRALRVKTLPVGPAPAPITYAIVQREDGTDLNLSGALPESGLFALPRTSDGMARNAALALTAALLLGTPARELRRRLAGWRPAALRGEWRREPRRLLYLDCYNANPASMADALAAFVRSAPSDQPRLYILGAMEELGPEAPRFHEELGRSLALRPQDVVCLLGSHAAAVRTGALAAGARSEAIEIAETIEPIAHRLEAFDGAVFIKGSRRYQLERLVPGAAH
jgi:UDP-N-acetylmuramoyl-tripeptide--D-alanyl-D-alanine ligase